MLNVKRSSATSGSNRNVWAMTSGSSVPFSTGFANTVMLGVPPAGLNYRWPVRAKYKPNSRKIPVPAGINKTDPHQQVGLKITGRASSLLSQPQKLI